MLPTQALSDTDPAPFFFCKDPEDTRAIGFEVVLWNEFEHRLRKYDVAEARNVGGEDI